MRPKNIEVLEDLIELKKEGLKTIYPSKSKIMVGMASCGLASGAGEVYSKMKYIIDNNGIQLIVIPVGCLGFCQKEPLVDVSVKGLPRIIYGEITPEKVEELIDIIVNKKIKKEWIIGKIDQIKSLITEEVKKYPISIEIEETNSLPSFFEIPFYKKQSKIALRDCGIINPNSIQEYIAMGGYFSLFKVLKEYTSEDVIEEMIKSGLRGRGGAGFLTGKKWSLCRKSKGEKKYIICNADEGDPGAYIDGSILEGDPFSIIEGMTIGAYAIGSDEGYIYVRAEYPLAVERISAAMSNAEKYGLLGENIFNSGFNFKINIVRGSGAFVCGEETAMISSIEGHPGEPRQRPPYPVEKGLWGNPTNINNVETWANVPPIISKGKDWYNNIGDGLSKGTKVFSLVGKIKNTGLVEVPMGISLQEIIYDIGGGIAKNKKFRSVQTGGPSGGCIPLELINIPVDFEHLTDVGSIMGSGGMVVMDEDTCVVDIAKYFLNFTNEESCGKCVPCREGTKQMLKILTDITNGKGKEGDIELLEELSHAVKDGALCGLGRTAPNPVLSTIRYFRDEYEQHIKYRRCSAMVCKEIVFTPCKYNCPIHTDVPAFIALVAQRKYRDSFDVIRKDNPLPIVCGYICHHPCEDRCRHIESEDKPMFIKGLKRFIGDQELNKGMRAIPIPKVRKKSKAVAIIGSGPAGLAAGLDLVKWGYKVTIFEKEPNPGGMIASAIPDFRLPKDVLNKEIGLVMKAGIEVKTNTCIGKDISFDELFLKGYSAILIATGAHKSIKMGIPGEDKEGIIDGLEFLKDVNIGKKPQLGKVVGVIGSGNTAIDSARTARRLGCDKVSIIYRRTKADMPAMKTELEAGFEEGIEFIFLTAPVEVISENEKLTAIKCIKMGLGDFDRSGRRRPIPIKGSEFIIPMDTLLVAVGQEPDISFLPKDYDLEISKWKTLAVNPETLVSSYDGIFAAGDVVTGPSTIADSIAHGKRAAESIRRYLEGEKLEREYFISPPSMYIEPIKLTPEEVLELKRPEMPKNPVGRRKGNFNIVELGFTEKTAMLEAKRCLRCDLKEK